MKQQGGILIFLTFLVVLAGAGFWVIKESAKSLPKQRLYTVKRTLEDYKLAFIEFDYVKRASIYIDFANKRLDELEALEEKDAPNDELIGIAEDFWDEEQRALRELVNNQARAQNTSDVKKQFSELRDRQEDVLKKLLYNTPAPGFYKLNQIIEDSRDALDRAGIGN